MRRPGSQMRKAVSSFARGYTQALPALLAPFPLGLPLVTMQRLLGSPEADPRPTPTPIQQFLEGLAGLTAPTLACLLGARPRAAEPR